MAFVQELLRNVSIPKSERQATLDRVYGGPGIPDPNGTTASFWQKTPHPELLKSQSAELPETADVVIIGSGITGTSVARTLLAEGAASSDASIVMLEAREVCSGATGRNGGHCLETAEEYLALREAWGKEAAQKMTKFKLMHLGTLMSLAEAYGITEEAQVRKVQFISAYFDDESWKMGRASIEAFKEDMIEESTEWEIVEGSAEMEEHHLPEAVGIIKGPASALWPYKFVTAILADLRREHRDRFIIETNTPVLQITKEGDLYEVKTTRGSIKSKHVVHCTNGHSAYLIPELLGRVYPVRGQMSAQKSPSGLPDQSHKHSWLFNYGTGFDYLTQLPVVDGLCDGEMMLGGGFVNSAFNGIREIGVSRDDSLDKDAGDHLGEVLNRVFNKSYGQMSPVKAMWTGTMGFSADGLPWVGEIPEDTVPVGQSSPSQGRQWVAAGFSGEGMVNTWHSGEALGQMILGVEQGRTDSVRTELASWFPKEMMITKERIRGSKLSMESAFEGDGHVDDDFTALSLVPVTPARL